ARLQHRRLQARLRRQPQYLKVEQSKLVWADADGEETIVGLRWSGWFLGAAARMAGATNPAVLKRQTQVGSEAAGTQERLGVRPAGIPCSSRSCGSEKARFESSNPGFQ